MLLQSIATGVMPVLVDDRLSFVICTGDDLVQATLLPDGSYDFEPDDTDPHAKADTCPWAIAHAPADLAASPDIPAPTLQSHALSPLLAPSPVPFGSSTRTPPARAPPIRS